MSMFDPRNVLKSSAQDRPVDWRWQRAVYGHNGHGKSDRWINAAGKILEAVRFGNSVDGLVETDRSMRAGVAAFKIGSDDTPITKIVLESRVLAGESTEQIAEKLGLARSTIQAYEAMFFDVRSRLANDKFILWSLAGGLGSRPMAFGTRCRLTAYLAGAEALDCFLHFCVTVIRPEIKPVMGQIVAPEPGSLADALTYIVGNACPVTPRTIPYMAEAYANVLNAVLNQSQSPDDRYSHDTVARELRRLTDLAADVADSVAPESTGHSAAL